jgi:hypothetical protein
MQAFEEINRQPSRRELLQFALIIAVGAALLGAMAQFAWGKPHGATVIWSLGAAVAAGALVPGLGRLLYIAWMGLGVSVGLITGPVILFVLYLVVITPVALVFRLMGRDALERRIDHDAASYWKTHATTSDMSRYYKQY